MTGESCESVIWTSCHVRYLDRAFQNRNRFLEPAEAAVDGGEDVKAHGEVEAGLAFDSAALEGLGGPDGVVEGLSGPFA